MDKIDLTKIYKSYYTAQQKPELLAINKSNYISIQGKGDPSGETFAQKLSAIYAVAYALKFMYKVRDMDYVVAKLESQWYFDETKYKGISIEDASSKIPRQEWFFRLLIQLPEYVLKSDLKFAKENVVFKKSLLLAEKVEWFELPARKVVQMLHVGPFDRETETLFEMREFMSGKNFKKIGHHHEIYLSDFRRTAPNKLKTILREPVLLIEKHMLEDSFVATNSK